MDLATLSRQYGDFFVPAFSVKVAGDDLVRDTLVAVSQVEVDMMLGGAAHFSFTVVNAYSIEMRAFATGRNKKLLDILSFGAEVDVCMGYGDARATPLVLSGVITEISTSFPEAGTPELVISGYDHAFPLTTGKNSRTWSGARDSDAVRDIASQYNLMTDLEPTRERRPQIEQNQESDFEFLKKLAEANHYELFVDAHKVLHFHPPHDKADAVARLAWGEGLISFKPEANLARQIAKVEIFGWDPKRKEKIVGVARAGQESGLEARSRSGGQQLKSFVRDPSRQPALRLRQPVFTQAEADQRARAMLNERAKEFLTGEAESVGLPELRPDRNVFLDRLGEPFSKTYYIQQATHKIDAGGYRTRFKVKETGL
jgi:phage protein D